MASLAFDADKFVDALEKSGMAAKQAKALAGELAERFDSEADIRSAIAALDKNLNGRMDALNGRMDSLETVVAALDKVIEAQNKSIDDRFKGMSDRIDGLYTIIADLKENMPSKAWWSGLFVLLVIAIAASIIAPVLLWTVGQG